MIQTAAGIEHQLPHGTSFAVNYSNTLGIHQLLTRDINAPGLPYNVTSGVDTNGDGQSE